MNYFKFSAEKLILLAFNKHNFLIEAMEIILNMLLLILKTV